MAQKPLHLLVVEDDPLFVRTLQLQLGDGHAPGGAAFVLTFAGHAELALQLLAAQSFDALLLDLHLGAHEHGLSALPGLVAAAPHVPVVVHSVATDHATIVQAMRAGAYDYVPKHVGVRTLGEQLRALVQRARTQRNERAAAAQPAEGGERAAEPARKRAPDRTPDRAEEGPADARRRQRRAVAAASSAAAQPGAPETLAMDGMVGDSAAMQKLRAAIGVARRSRGSVVITGPSGAGKELVARALGRANEPFVAVDAATLEGQLAASVLFGHERGAFTGAERAQVGLFERAHGGTLYFDEVANMPLDVQAKLLRVLQEREVWPMGARAPRALQFRLVCATNADLHARVRSGDFRADLLTRMQVFTLHVPALAERQADVPALFDHLLTRHGGAPRRWNHEVAQALARAPFAGNVRELENAAVVALAHAEAHEVLRPEHLPPALAAWVSGDPGVDAACTFASDEERSEAQLAPMPAMPEATRDFYAQVRAFERRTLIRAFAEHRGNISAMARTLGMDRSSLYAKLRLYAIHVPRAV